MNRTTDQHILERIVSTHILQLESNVPKDYKIFLYGWTLKFLRLSKRNEWAGDSMRRLYAVATALDGSKSERYTEVQRVLKW